MALITDLPASTTVASTDVFVKDTGSATQKITAPNLANQMAGHISTATSAYTPTVTLSSGATADNIVATYRSYGKIYIVSGRFRVTSATNANASISYPNSINVSVGGASPVGLLFKNDGRAYPIRATDGYFTAIDIGGNNNSIPFSVNEYVAFFAVANAN